MGFGRKQHNRGQFRTNTAIGFNCVISTSTKLVKSGLRGSKQALYVLAGYKGSRYEFIFTNLAPNCVRHYATVCAVHKAYAGSRMYRDLKLRGPIVHNKQLRVLPLEKITIRDSKFGDALVIVVRPTSGGYVLGFRADPHDRLHPLLEELQTLHQAYTDKPVFGVEIKWNNEESREAPDDIEELEEIGEPRGEMGPTIYLASQLAQGPEDLDVQPVYSSYLGLAIEPLKDGVTLKALFEVQTMS
ncbi:unnamed protein product [Leptidea sinapis]|uniref:BBSome complex member BBS5 PH domain-containing protein n=1 Tax=Leptidea sinapis TaxID=189913 RepID=A0A5E4PSZ6_9NEOP|nr:unnamed protein product [Leptidea sinapis]